MTGLSTLVAMNNPAVDSSSDARFIAKDIVAIQIDQPCTSLQIEQVEGVGRWLQAVGRSRDRKIILDFTKVSVVGATLLGILASHARTLERQGCELRLCGLDDACVRVAIATTPLEANNFLATN